MQNHTINKVSFQIPAEDFEQAKALQSKTKHWSNNTLPILLDKYFSKKWAKAELIYLDKLEISIPEYPWLLSENEWFNKIDQSLNLTSQQINPFKLIFHQWIFYLQTGSFERNAILKNNKEIGDFLFKNIGQLSNTEISVFTDSTLVSHFFSRLFSQTDFLFLKILFEKIFKEKGINFEVILKILSEKLVSEKENSILVLQLVFDYLKKGEERQSLSVLEKIAQNVDFKTITFTKMAESIGKIELKNKSLHIINDKTLDCKNAGLVILFPYIKRFFENIGLIQNGEFTEQKSQNTAIQCLQYLATGQSISEEEADYLLPKILCGVEIEYFVEFRDELHDYIKVEADELLKSVIQNWQKLGNSSIEALRESFLKRNGFITIEENQIILKVEESGVDILLDSLPWGFRNYHLPWMRFNLVTEWY
ncbi:MAG: contractile injection system tape measure protein [Bacteroidota bacterium]